MFYNDCLDDTDTLVLDTIKEAIAGTSGFIYPKEIADNLDLTYSRVVIPLRKLESKGDIRTKAMGMDGVFVEFIKID